MSDRQLILEAVQEMPETLSIHEIVDELLLLSEVKRRLEKNPAGKGVQAKEILDETAMLASIQRGREQIRRGEGIPHDEVVKQFNSWITESSGRPTH